MNKIITFDLDGTLIDQNNQIIGGDETITLLKQLHENGYKLIINTGRLDHDIYYINKKYRLDVDYRISQNGAVIQNSVTSVAKLLDKVEALHLYEHLKTTNLRIELNTVSNRYWHEERDPDFPKEYYDSSNIRKDFKEVIEYQPTVLFLLIGELAEINEVQLHINASYQKIQAVKTSQTSLEILAKGVSKGNTILEVFPEAYIISIGDSENDYSMFEKSNESYYVGQGTCRKASYSRDTILDVLKEIIRKEEDSK